MLLSRMNIELGRRRFQLGLSGPLLNILGLGLHHELLLLFSPISSHPHRSALDTAHSAEADNNALLLDWVVWHPSFDSL